MKTSARRGYVQRERAARSAETRRRIVAATLELHRTVGPAATSISEVARRAGVQRLTIYNHFPTDADLFGACSTDWRAQHPNPDLEEIAAEGDAGRRLRLGLERIYAWYRETEPMTANVLRDMTQLPALRTIIDAGLAHYLGNAQRILAEPFEARSRPARRVRPAVAAALDFHTWQRLAPLGDRDAAELAAALVEAA